jgi:hypothetical protein
VYKDIKTCLLSETNQPINLDEPTPEVLRKILDNCNLNKEV